MLRAPIIVGLSLALCSQALGLEFWKEGKYVCLTDRAAGLQGEADHRSAGKIELPDNRMRFFLAVERIRNLPKECWNNFKILEVLRSAVEKGDYDLPTYPDDVQNPGDFLDFCLSPWVIRIDLGEETPEFLRSLTGIRFEGFESSFSLRATGHFEWIVRNKVNPVMGTYVAEGRCDIVG